jgi:2'-5' RNA ligase
LITHRVDQSKAPLRTRSYTDLFFALWPDEATRSQIAEATSALGGRITAARNLHLSLGFVSHVSPTQVEECIHIGAALVQAPLELELTHIEYWRDVGIAALVLRQTPDLLLQLVMQLRDALSRCGLDIDPRPFRAHVVVSRHISDFRTKPLAAPIVWRPHCVALIEPQLAERFRSYQVREMWPAMPRSGDSENQAEIAVREAH